MAKVSKVPAVEVKVGDVIRYKHQPFAKVREIEAKLYGMHLLMTFMLDDGEQIYVRDFEPMYRLID